MTRITIEVDEEQKKQMKILATLSNLSLKDFILDRTIGIEPNEETIKSFKDYQNNKNLTTHGNFDDLIKDLNS